MSLILESPSRDNPLDVLALRSRKRDAALASMVDCAASRGAVRDGEIVTRLLIARERLGPAVLANGVAIPHARSLAILRPHLVIGRSAKGLTWPGVESPVQVVVMVLDPGAAGAAQHERRVARIAQALRQVRTRQKLAAAAEPATAWLVLREAFE